jgi:hypothetical protein
VTVTCVCCPDRRIEGTIRAVVGVGSILTVTVAEPDLDVSCVDLAVIVAVPALLGVNTPVLTVPRLVGLTDHVTEELKLPVPVTVGVQADV